MQLVAVYFQIQSLQQFGGVAATHLDWTMVPYVRKSFRKHYVVEWIKQLEEFNNFDILDCNFNDFNKWVEKMTVNFFIESKLNEDDFYLGNESLDHSLYKKALFETKKEAYQATEGLFHNLNTLQLIVVG